MPRPGGPGRRSGRAGERAKLATAPFAVGLAVGCLAIAAPLGRRVAIAAAFCAGVVVALGAAGGPWLWHVWRETGNPVFPELNQLIGSTLNGHYAVATLPFAGLGAREILLLPWLAVLHPERVAEVPFVDWRIAAAFTVIPLALIAGALRSKQKPDERGVLAMLLVSGLAAFVLWAVAHPVYRHLIALEMLTPLLIWLALARLPMPRSASAAIAIVLLLTIVAGTHSADWGRVPWRQAFVEVEVPALPRPASTLVILANKPTAFIAAAFPRAVSFVQLDPELVPPDDETMAWNRRLHERIAAHRGDIVAVWSAEFQSDVPGRLARFGLAAAPQDCRPLATNLTVVAEQRLIFCALHREP